MMLHFFIWPIMSALIFAYVTSNASASFAAATIPSGVGFDRHAQLGPSPRNYRAGQVQVWKHRVCNRYQ